MHFSRCLIPSLALCFLSAAASAQTAPLPKDPSALMQLAREQNGLHGSDLKPWHLRAQWQAVEQGKPTAQGTWEMWWVNSQESKVTITAPGFQQTVYQTPHGILIDGASGLPKQPVYLAQQMLLEPVPDWPHVASVGLQILYHHSKSQKLTCAAPENQMGHLALETAMPQYCFTGNLPAVRLVANWGMEAILNGFVQFQGRYVARDIQVLRDKAAEFDIHVVSLEPLTAVAEKDFTPPPSAVSVPAGKLTVPADVMNGNWIGGNPPDYPPTARQDDVQGTVTLSATVTKDGALKDIHVVSGPAELQDSAMRAVSTWRYLPWLVNGNPVDVNTTIDVNFKLPRQ